jgi:cytochrome c oxidase subunit III
VSETILDHGYVPEEHAPDPVVSHGDPTAPGKIAIWLFLASEIMFFIAILGTYIILRSGSPELFSKHAKVLSKALAGVNTVVLIFSSLTMALAVDASQRGDRKRTILCLLITLVCALGFLGIKFKEYYDKAVHHTFQVVDQSSPTGVFVYDGHVHKHADKWMVSGYRMPMQEHGQFDIHLVCEEDVKKAGDPVNDAEIDPARVTNDINYGPWKSIFYACYFALTGVHGIHVIGGIVPLSLLLIQACRGKLFPAHTEYTGLYWHFVDLVWIFLFPLLYLI